MRVASRADCSSAHEVIVGYFGERRGGYVAERDNGHAIPRLDGTERRRICAIRLGQGNDPDQSAFVNDGGIRHTHQILKRRQHILAPNRTGGDDRDRSMNTRIDREIESERVSEQSFGDDLNIGLIEIYF